MADDLHGLFAALGIRRTHSSACPWAA